jgi:ABC-type nitrate/sulfonate/bicarbonate transport system permease component
VAFWELFIVVTGMPRYVLPPLHEIVQVGIAKADAVFLPAAWVTLQEISLGFFFGVSVGLTLGIAIFHSSVLSRGLLPLVVASQAIPVIAIAPILIIWFGFGMAPKVMVATLIAFFPVVVNTIAGLGSVDREVINLMRSLDATRWHVFSKVRFPAALPHIFSGLKNAAAISAIGAIVGEWVGADVGLGPVMIAANSAFQTADIFAAILYLSVMSITLFLIVLGVERVAIPWYFIARGK